MAFPDFFSRIAPLTLRDPLAQVLGAAEDGVIEYRYADAVRLAGHSCPTVAGAWLLAGKALALLYPAALPERGGVAVAMREAQDQGTAGVVAHVLGLVTGAAAEGGFKGLGGRHARRNLLTFGQAIQGEVRFTRLDNAAYVELAYHPQRVASDPAMADLMPKVMAGSAQAGERAEFGRLWQERVRRILLEGEAGLIEVVAGSA